MTRKIFILVLISLSIGKFECMLGNSIQTWNLDEDVVYSLAMHPLTTLTVCFPNVIEGLKGTGFFKGLEEQGGDYIYSFNPGDRHFSLTPVAQDVQARNLNVLLENKVYVLKPFIVGDPDEALAVVKFQKNCDVKDKELDNIFSSFIEKKSVLPEMIKETSTVHKMLGMIDLLKVLGGLNNDKAQAVISKFPNFEFSEKFNKSLDYGLYKIHLKYVLRNNDSDALGFCFLITNQSKGDLVLDPESLSVRVGEYVYHQSICDIQYKLKKSETATGYFVIKGDGEGLKNYLAINNNFKISLDIVDPAQDENS